MISNYFGDMEKGEHPYTKEEIPKNAWMGIRANIDHRFDRDSFSINRTQFYHLLKAEILDIEWPLTVDPPKCSDILELIQFCYKHIDRPITQKYRELISDEFVGSYGSPERAGQAEFKNSINLIFYRNYVIYRLEGDGRITRAIPKEMENVILNSEFRTEDKTFNELMDTARENFLNPDIEIRRESLEKLWDAWERLKTLEPAKDKKESIEKLLKIVSPEPKFCKVLDDEAHALTDIGNVFMIRHTEIGKIKIESPHQIDYLFYRLFSLIYPVLKSTKRID